MAGGEHYWNSLAPLYDALYENEWSLFENSIIREDLKRLLSRAVGKRILDIGCGTGLGYDLLGGASSNVDYVGLDTSAVMLREFGKRHPTVRTVLASGDSLAETFLPCQFDIVISINVAASFPSNTQGMLRDIFTVLVPGGLSCLSFLNRGSLRRLVHCEIRSDEPYRTRGDSNDRNFVWAKAYSRSQLAQMCVKAGFAEVSCSYRSVLGGVWESAAAVRIEPILSNVVPWLGHSIIVSGLRSAKVGGRDGKVEAILRP